MYFNDRKGGSCTSQNASQTSATSLAANWSSGPKWQSCPVSAYATGTLSTVGKTGGGTTSTTPTGVPDPPPVTVPTILPPANLGAPTVSGDAVDGQTLTTSDGTWLDTPTSYSHQWQSCNNSGSGCANIAGATGSSYTLTDSDIGKTVRSVVTAANGAGSATANSAATSADGDRRRSAPRRPPSPAPPVEVRPSRPRTGFLVGQPEHGLLPVAGLQQLRRELQQHRRRGRQQLHPGQRRRRPHHPRGRDRGAMRAARTPPARRRPRSSPQQ